MHLIVTRPRPEADRTAQRLRRRGHRVIVSPALEMAVLDGPRIDAAQADALALTSARAVIALIARGELDGAAAEALRRLPVYAVGTRTARAARAAGFSEVIDAAGNLNDLVRCLAAGSARRIVSPAGRRRTGDLAGKLAALGRRCHIVEVYDMRPTTHLAARAKAALRCGSVDAATIYSARSGEAFFSCVERAGLRRCLDSLTVYAISPQAGSCFRRSGARILIPDAPNENALLALIDSAVDAG